MNTPNFDILPLSSWLTTQKNSFENNTENTTKTSITRQPAIIAGPCSAETEEQLLETCLALAEVGVDAFRAGVWKPRTRPGMFEGNGEIALSWIQTVKKYTKIPFSVEVATPQHVELALKYGVEILWIGARTTVNPFNVQDLADCLRGVDVPVMIKNPVNPDLSLWIGAIERIYNAGIRKITAIHRGFSGMNQDKYRNAPTWQIPLELRRMFPEIPLICDPSHITGRRDLIESVSQKALDLNYDGLMIETHPNPDTAWSDAKQQITPARLKEILKNLKIRNEVIDNSFVINQLEEIRSKIDTIDRELLEVLMTRMNLVEQIGTYKKDHHMTVFQRERWNEIFNSRAEWAEQMQLNKKFVTQLFELIHVESIKKQTQIVNQQK